MLKVMVVTQCQPEHPSFLYRALWPLQVAIDRGQASLYMHGNGDFQKPDVAFFQFAFRESDEVLMRGLLDMGVPCVVDLDDDYANLDPSNTANLFFGHDRDVIAKHHLALRTVKDIELILPDAMFLRDKTVEEVQKQAIDNYSRHVRMARLATAVTVSRPSLAKTYRGFGVNNIVIAPNREKGSLWRNVQRTPLIGTTVIGWAGGISHYFNDLTQLIMPVTTIMKKYAHVRLSLLGVPEAASLFTGVPKERITFGAWSDFYSYQRNLAGFDITLAPMAGNKKFALGKSHIRLTQSWMLGIPTIASPIPYGEIAEHGGLIARNAKEWTDALEKLVCDVDTRFTLGANGKAWVEDNATLESNLADERIRLFESLTIGRKAV